MFGASAINNKNREVNAHSCLFAFFLFLQPSWTYLESVDNYFKIKLKKIKINEIGFLYKLHINGIFLVRMTFCYSREFGVIVIAFHCYCCLLLLLLVCKMLIGLLSGW